MTIDNETAKKIIDNWQLIIDNETAKKIIDNWQLIIDNETAKKTKHCKIYT